VPPKRPRRTSPTDGLSRKTTADVLRKIRGVQKEIRTLKGRMDAAQKRSQEPALRRAKKR
jgi:hypothetical protein